MKFDKSMLTLYAVTDRAYLRGRRLEDRVEEAIRGGATLIQLREKDLPGNSSRRPAPCSR